MSPRIAILGAGPIGLEAALYARYLGCDVTVFERGETVAANVHRWGHVQLFTPFSMNSTSLGVAAIAAQQPGWRPPPGDALLTGHEFHADYLAPLAATDLVADCIQLSQQVVSIGRPPLLKRELSTDRARHAFHVLLATDGREHTATADIVIDATGTYGNHNWMGPGGMPAPGETSVVERTQYGIPDVLGQDRDKYAGVHTLVVGAGPSAATTLVALSRLAAEDPATTVTWVTRQRVNGEAGPVSRIDGDRLPERDELAAAANALAHGASPHVRHIGGASIERICVDDDQQITVQLADQLDDYRVDRVVANVGYRPDRQLYEELQVHECYASQGPMKIAAELLATESADCLDQTSTGPQSLVVPEPSFYILGSKSYGRDSRFLLATGFSQIKQLFTIIGQREDLDLYATMPQLATSYRRQ